MQPDKKCGRGQKINELYLKSEVRNSGIPIYQPEKLSADLSLFDVFQKNRPDFLITFAYGQMLDERWLSLPSLFPLNIHASILPKYRGASPIHATILNGDPETGICLMKMVKKMDAGPVYKIIKLAINNEITFQDLSDFISTKASEYIPDLVFEINENSIFNEQNESLASYTKKINKVDAFINFNESNKAIFRKYFAFSLWPCIWTTYNQKRLKLVEISLSDRILKPGHVVCDASKIFIGTLDGSIEIKKIQPESKKVMSAVNFLTGHPNFCGSVLPC